MRYAIALGLLILGVFPSAPARAEPKETIAKQRVRIASFNVWGIPAVADKWDERRTKLPAAFRKLELDVICLQEVWLRAHQKELATALASTHKHVVHAAGGLMVLSRWPVTSHAFQAYPRYPELNFAERMAGKGYLDVTIRTPVGPMRIINTHLTWTRNESVVIKKQLGVLLTHLEGHGGAPLFVVGDFNTPTLDSSTALHPQYLRLLRAGLLSARPPKKGGNGEFLWPANTRQHWPRKRVGLTGWDPDHVFFRIGKTVHVRRESSSLHFTGIEDALSDHNLVRTTFTLLKVGVEPSKKKEPRPEVPTGGRKR